MIKIFKNLILLLVVVILMIMPLSAEEKKIEKTFKPADIVKISTVSGDCAVQAGKSGEVRLVIVYDYPEDVYQPEFFPEGNTLYLQEKFAERSRTNNGRARWSVTVPEKTEIIFKTASGDFSLSGIKGAVSTTTASGDLQLDHITGELTVKTASGDLDVKNIQGTAKIITASGDVQASGLRGDISLISASGDIDASDLSGEDIKIVSASGDMDLENLAGSLKVKSASGEIEARQILIKGESQFVSASGDLEVQLAATPAFDFSVISASGDAVLNYNGNAVVGNFELVARKDRGKIVSSIKFDNEEIFIKHGQKYMRKTFKKKADSPKVLIETASGKAELVEK